MQSFLFWSCLDDYDMTCWEQVFDSSLSISNGKIMWNLPDSMYKRVVETRSWDEWSSIRYRRHNHILENAIWLSQWLNQRLVTMVADSIYLKIIVWKQRSVNHSSARELSYLRDQLEEHHYKHNEWFLLEKMRQCDKRGGELPISIASHQYKWVHYRHSERNWSWTRL